MIVLNTVRDAVLRINLLQENKVVTNLAERRFEMRRDDYNCEPKFYGSLSNKMAVALISNPEFQLKIPES